MTTAEYLTACSQIPTLKLEPLFEEYSQGSFRARFRVQGMTSFAIKDNIIMFTSKNSIYISKAEQIPTLIPFKSNHLYNESFERTDPKVGGNQNNMIAFIRERDIWVADFLGNERQLTFCSDNSEDPTLNCGGVEYMMQEEFHRSTGYYWAPANSNELTERIVYLETSEDQVEQFWISKQENPPKIQEPSNKKESIRYPYAGKKNAVSKIKIIEFDSTEIVHKQLTRDLQSQFPWVEYIVRFGWFSDGKK
ncbi:dipeptidyl peptidase IV N-terminal region-domain-containing protein [Sporodiniella umbellata]|nr:dipeptidyl peptidase IV N-terminal region-domain-containing protein [Sporodiniella umbellata]